jgi:hypothetical protein
VCEPALTQEEEPKLIGSTASGERDDVPDNVEFKIADFNQRWPFEDGSVDMVHMRQLQFGVGSFHWA